MAVQKVWSHGLWSSETRHKEEPHGRVSLGSPMPSNFPRGRMQGIPPPATSEEWPYFAVYNVLPPILCTHVFGPNFLGKKIF